MNASRATTLLAAILLAGALALAGCGDDGGETSAETATQVMTETTAAEESGTGEEGDEGKQEDDGSGLSEPAPPPAEVQVERGAEDFLISPDSAKVCEDLVTDDLLKQSYGSLQGCLQGRPKPTLAKTAEVTKPKVDSVEATVTATPDGGLYDGAEVEFTFVREGESWLIDSVSADIPVGP